MALRFAKEAHVRIDGSECEGNKHATAGSSTMRYHFPYGHAQAVTHVRCSYMVMVRSCEGTSFVEAQLVLGTHGNEADLGREGRKVWYLSSYLSWSNLLTT